MMDSKSYKQLIKKHSPKSPAVKNSFLAFLIGGLICALSQLLCFLFINLGIKEETSYLLVTVSLIFISAFLTGIGVFDRIAKHAGAGTLVPVTGFANSVVSPAVDTRSEGYVLGVGSKIFTVAGPVILYGIISGTVYGIIYLLFGDVSLF
jgi:stage V sporulation protein AC